eukprot:834040_1
MDHNDHALIATDDDDIILRFAFINDSDSEDSDDLFWTDDENELEHFEDSVSIFENELEQSDTSDGKPDYNLQVDMVSFSISNGSSSLTYIESMEYPKWCVEHSKYESFSEIEVIPALEVSIFTICTSKDVC